MATSNLIAGLLLTLFASSALAAESVDTGCSSVVSRGPQITAARSALQAAPAVPARRIHLSDLLIEAECYDEAIHVLEDGEELDPRNALLQNRLTRARSMVREKQYFAGLDDAEASARLARGKLRCTRLNDIAACDEVLGQQPRNVDILMAKGDALLKANRNEDALNAYARATQAAPDNAVAAGKLQALQAQRQEMQKRCAESQGDAALQACTAILVKGAPSEFDLEKRIGLLQQSANQPARALEAYIAANTLHPGDKSVALAILTLLGSTKRDDVVALTARGSSLLTLGRPAEAIAPLRQANALTPGMPEIVKQLAAAEAASRSKPRVVASNVPDIPPTRARLFSNAAAPGRSN
jgi:tetratricopeptide (TPR) repeat protein